MTNDKPTTDEPTRVERALTERDYVEGEIDGAVAAAKRECERIAPRGLGYDFLRLYAQFGRLEKAWLESEAKRDKVLFDGVTLVRKCNAAVAEAETQRDEAMGRLRETRHWSVAIRALDSWHEINLQDSRCDCPGHKRIEVLRTALKEMEDTFLLQPQPTTPECERVSQCCGAPEHSDVENFCAQCHEGTGFECSVDEVEWGEGECPKKKVWAIRFVYSNPGWGFCWEVFCLEHNEIGKRCYNQQDAIEAAAYLDEQENGPRFRVINTSRSQTGGSDIPYSFTEYWVHGDQREGQPYAHWVPNTSPGMRYLQAMER